MMNYLKGKILGSAILAIAFLSVSVLSAAPKKTYSSKYYSTKSYAKKKYSKKAPYAGYGKTSKVNGLPKSRIVSGHVKKTNKGCTYVNPYGRSK